MHQYKTKNYLLYSLLLIAVFANCGENQHPSSHAVKIDGQRKQKKELMGKIEADAAQITELLSSSNEGLSIVADLCGTRCNDQGLVGTQLDILVKKVLDQLNKFLDKV